MADLTIQETSEGGLAASYVAAAAAGDAVLNLGGDVILHVRNGDASSHTVTVTAQATSREVAGFGAMTKGDAAVAVPAGNDRFIGPFPTGAFNDANGKVQIAYDAVTAMTVAAIRVKRAP